MDLDDFIIAVFCLNDEAIPAALEGQRLRERGPAPILADSEVVTMEIAGEYLGYEREAALFAYFRHHYPHFFPALRALHRTTFTRPAKRPTAGASKSGSGSTWQRRYRMRSSSLASIVSPCPSASSPARIAVSGCAARPPTARIISRGKPALVSASLCA